MATEDPRPPFHLNHIRRPDQLLAGEAINRDVRGCVGISAIAGAGATVTVSRIDSLDATAHGTGARAVGTVAATTLGTFTVDWAFVRISTAGGPATVSVH